MYGNNGLKFAFFMPSFFSPWYTFRYTLKSEPRAPARDVSHAAAYQNTSPPFRRHCLQVGHLVSPQVFSEREPRRVHHVYEPDPAQNQSDVDEIRKALKNAKGPGNFGG